MNGFCFVTINNKLLLTQYINKEEIICELCWMRYANIKVSKIHHSYIRQTHWCYACFGAGHTHVFVKDIIYGAGLFSEMICLLNTLKNNEIPKYIFYEIGKSMKTNDGIINRIELESIAVFNIICNLARRAIREFCLYCIRYQKDRVNKDIRRKICELIWEDKIKFLK